MNLNNSHGVVHTFNETPILISQLLGEKPTKRGLELIKKLVYDPAIQDKNRARSGAIKSKSAFYVLKLPSCTKALKIGRANATSDGILTRLGEYKTKYGNAKILYLRTFTYTAKESTEKQPVSKFEKRLKEKLKENNINTIRGTEYFSNDMLDTLKTIINSTESPNEDYQPVQVRRSARNNS